MTIDEAIKHAEEVAEEKQAIVDACDYYGDNMAKCEKCGKEHRQLAEWLKELKQLREQKPCEDCVSREAVHNMLEDIPIVDTDKWFNWLQKACLRLADLPSVIPKGVTVTDFADKCRECGKMKNGEWIPVSVRLPEDYQRVLITVVRYDGERNVRVAKYRNKFKTFDCLENHEQWEVGEEMLLAWRPLPEPYQEEKE